MPPRPTLPRIAITYCTQCRWLLRAAYYAQELLTTFSTTIGEVALIPATGGLFQVEIFPAGDGHGTEGGLESRLLWDRKSEGGFPETKVLKQLVRDVIDPAKGLGHSDVGGKKGSGAGEGQVGKDGGADVKERGTAVEGGGSACGPDGC